MMPIVRMIAMVIIKKLLLVSSEAVNPNPKTLLSASWEGS